MPALSFNPSDLPAARGRSPRRRVLLDGQFQSRTDNYRVAIRNISCTGAAVECSCVLPDGLEGVLLAPGLDRLCDVVWHRGGFHGLRFDEPLSQAKVLELHGITREHLHAAEREAVRSWYGSKAL